MSFSSPLAAIHLAGDALLAPYGPPRPAPAPLQPAGDPADADEVQLVQAFDPIEIEYAAIRRHAAVFDAAHRATLAFTGPDRIGFLGRMLTQELKGFEPYTSHRAFTLNRKGRIDADLRLINLGPGAPSGLSDTLLADVDAFAAERARSELDKYLITEDAAIADTTADWSVLSLHGPSAAALLARLSRPIAGAPIAAIQPGQVSIVELSGGAVVVDRWDWAGGVIGLEVRVPRAAAATIYETISTPWSARPRDTGNGVTAGVAPTTDLARRIGWHALNIARIEGGTPLYMLDFGPDSLPHECGDEVLNDRVSFKKGCYLGQEIVARMHSRGHPKHKLVPLKFDAPVGTSTPPTGDFSLSWGDATPQAVTGTPIVEADAPGAGVVGAVTSSCLSPLLSQTPIGFAMVKHSHTQPGQRLWAQLDGSRVMATVQDHMRFV